MIDHRSPFVSVVVPTYNRARYLPSAVDSVLGQTYGNLELVVVDDGSTDDTKTYLSGVHDSRLRVLYLSHGGNPARARNAAIRAARGSYLAFLDSDDLWVPEKLAIQIAAMRAQGYRWSYARFAMVDDIGEIPLRAGGPWYPYSGNILRELISTAAAIAISSLVVDRDLVDDIGGFDESEAVLYREDYDLCLRVALRAPVLAVPELLCYVRDHPGRGTAMRDDLYARSAEVYRKLERLVPDRALRRMCRRRCARHLVADARRYQRIGFGRQALRRLGEAFWYWPWYPRWWMAVVRSLPVAVGRVSAPGIR